MLKSVLLLMTLSCFVLLMACTDSDTNAEDEVFEVMTKMASIVGPGGTQEDHDYYLEHVTDNFNASWGYPTVADCAADIEGCIGEDPLDPPMRDTLKVNGDKATITVTSSLQAPTGDSFKLVFDATFVKQDGVWKGDTVTAGDDEIPGGVELVPLELNELVFSYDPTDSRITSGKFGFDVENKGNQVHEVVLFQVKKEAPLMELMESGDPGALGFPMGVKLPILPGTDAKMSIPELEPGRYVLVCHLPDQSVPGGEGPPHFVLGMISEFIVE